MFKSATVRSGDVPATLTNYPTYVDLSRLGITTLAEAQSVRVYADSGKSTEWAREIVSATEMHVLVPSLTSSTEIFVDWDGVRSDYAVGATYGRNAVWVDYVGVWHLEDLTSIVDSTGNGLTLTNDGASEVTAKIGKGGEFNKAQADQLSRSFSAGSDLDMTGDYHFSCLYYQTATVQGTNQHGICGIWGGSSSDRKFIHVLAANGSKERMRVLTANSAQVNTNYYSSDFDEQLDTWVRYGFEIDVSARDVAFMVENNFEVIAGTGASSLNSVTNAFFVGNFRDSSFDNVNAHMDEVRVSSILFGENRSKTENKNQIDEATFWGTWTDAGGGGGGGAAQAARRGAVMMM